MVYPRTTIAPCVADARVFLDVDDLKDIGALEQYIQESCVIMIFVSKGYFKARTTRALRCSRGCRWSHLFLLPNRARTVFARSTTRCR